MVDAGPPYPRPPEDILEDEAGGFLLDEYYNPLIGSQYGAGQMLPWDVWPTVISQYANSPILTQLILDLSSNIDQAININAFFDLIMNLDTAEGYGLDVWGRIVGVNRVLQVQLNNWFGFEESLPAVSTFGQEAFYSGAPLTSNYALSDQAYRLLIFAKAASNITSGSIQAINRILMNLFPGRGSAYVTEGSLNGKWFGFQESLNASGFNQDAFYSGSSIRTMTMTYTFEFQLTPVELAIVQNSGALPKSTGVAVNVVIL